MALVADDISGFVRRFRDVDVNAPIGVRRLLAPFLDEPIVGVEILIAQFGADAKIAMDNCIHQRLAQSHGDANQLRVVKQTNADQALLE